MALNHYVTLGRSGLKVSPFCLGAMTCGQESGFGTDEATAGRLMDRFIERGGNFIDTANIYSGGHSEQIVGNHIGRDAAKRDRIVIATKFGGTMRRGDPKPTAKASCRIVMHPCGACRPTISTCIGCIGKIRSRR
jgi:aryl-alcohol dehydrogenase-like predicted oxidoreductase